MSDRGNTPTQGQRNHNRNRSDQDNAALDQRDRKKQNFTDETKTKNILCHTLRSRVRKNADCPRGSDSENTEKCLKQVLATSPARSLPIRIVNGDGQTARCVGFRFIIHAVVRRVSFGIRGVSQRFRFRIILRVFSGLVVCEGRISLRGNVTGICGCDVILCVLHALNPNCERLTGRV